VLVIDGCESGEAEEGRSGRPVILEKKFFANLYILIGSEMGKGDKL
jgi:hypothetical protein